MQAKLMAGEFIILALAVLLAACQLGGLGEPAGTSAASDPDAMTCAHWLEITEKERVALADRLVGDSGDRLERIRIRQHQPEGTARELLILDVVTSLTKNCEVWPPRERPVGDVFDALY